MYYAFLIFVLIVLILILKKLRNKDKPKLVRNMPTIEDTLGPLSIEVKVIEEVNGNVLITGFIERGTLKLYDEVSVTSGRGMFSSRVVSIIFNGVSVQEAKAGSAVVVNIENITVNDVAIGDIIYR